MEMLIALYETPIVEQGGLRYKIQVRNYGGIWQQRHIWYPVEHSEPAWGGAVNRRSEDKWIMTIPQRAPDRPHWRRIDNQRPQENDE